MILEWPLLVLILALVLALVGQLFFSDRRYYNYGLVAYALAALATWLYAWLEKRRPSVRWPTDRRRTILVILAVLALGLCLGLEVRGVSYLAQIGLWVASMGLFTAAFVPSVRRWRWQELAERVRRHHVELVLAGLVFLAGAWLRAYNLEYLPAGFHGDEGEFAMVADAILKGAKMGPFTVGGAFLHPNLFHYLEAFSIWLFGHTVAGVRMISALVGIATLFPVYLLVRRLFGVWPALVASLLLVVSPWHIVASRLAWNEIPVPLTAALTLLFLYRGIESGRALDYCLAGLSLGIGIQLGSKSMFYLVIVVGLLLLYALLLRRGFLRTQYLNLVVLVVALFIAFAPLGLHYMRYGWKNLMLDPVQNRSLFRNMDRALQLYHVQSPLQVVRIQAEKALLVFDYFPDAGFFSYSQEPLLDDLTAPFFMVGLAYCLYHWRNLGHLLVLLWFVVPVAGNALSIDTPQSHRLIVMSPVPFILAALPLESLRQEMGLWLLPLHVRWRTLAYAVPVGLLLVGATYLNMDAFWGRYAARWPWLNVTDVARHVRDLGNDYQIYMVSDLPFGHGTIRYIAYGVQAKETRTAEAIMAIPDVPGKPVAFVVTPSHQQLLPLITSQYPDGVLTQYRQLTSYIVPYEQFHASVQRRDGQKDARP